MAAPRAPLWALLVWVDSWTLRCLYNRSDYSARIYSREFIELHREQSKVRQDGSRTVQVYYGLEAGRAFRVKLQWFEGNSGEILRSGLRDPKQMYADGADYHLHPGNRLWERIRRDPEKALPIVFAQRAYGRWRTYKCERWGPVEATRKVSHFLGVRRFDV